MENFGLEQSVKTVQLAFRYVQYCSSSQMYNNKVSNFVTVL